MSPPRPPTPLSHALGQQLDALNEIVEQALAHRLEQEQAAKRAFALLKPALPDTGDDEDPELLQLLHTLQLCRSVAYRWRARQLNGYSAINEIARRLQPPHGEHPRR